MLDVFHLHWLAMISFLSYIRQQQIKETAQPPKEIQVSASVKVCEIHQNLYTYKQSKAERKSPVCHYY